MNKTEAKKIVAVMMATYGNFKPEDPDMTAEVWANVFNDIPYQTLNAALSVYIREDKTGFAPVPGQLMDLIVKATSEEPLDESGAWALIKKAAANSNYNAEREFDALPKMVQRALGSPAILQGMGMMDETEMSYQRNQFIQNYRGMVAREQEVKRYPVAFQKQIAEVNKNQFQIESLRNPVPQIEQKEPESKGVPMPEWAREKMRELEEKFGGNR